MTKGIIRFSFLSLLAIVVLSFVSIRIISAFTGPTDAPPTGSGVISVSGTNVGIGTTSPGAKLQVHDSTATNASGKIKSSTTNVGGIFQAAEGNNRYFTTPASGLEIITTTNHPISFGVNESGSATPEMVIATNGNVGIGATDPGNNRLSVVQAGNGNNIAYFGTTATAPTVDLFRIDAQTAASGTGFNILKVLGPSTQTPLVIRGDGNVGIGTASPGYKLDVQGGNTRIQGQQYLQGTPTRTGVWLANPSDNVFQVQRGSDSANLLYVDAGGNVGIGNTGSTYKLDVTGNIRSTGGIYYNFAGVQEINTTGMVHRVAYNDAAPLIRFGEGADSSYVDFNTSAKTFGPSVNNSWDLGTTTNRWKNGYFAGALTVGSCTGCGGSGFTQAASGSKTYDFEFTSNSAAGNTFRILSGVGATSSITEIVPKFPIGRITTGTGTIRGMPTGAVIKQVFRIRTTADPAAAGSREVIVVFTPAGNDFVKFTYYDGNHASKPFNIEVATIRNSDGGIDTDTLSDWSVNGEDVWEFQYTVQGDSATAQARIIDLVIRRNNSTVLTKASRRMNGVEGASVNGGLQGSQLGESFHGLASPVYGQLILP